MDEPGSVETLKKRKKGGPKKKLKASSPWLHVLNRAGQKEAKQILDKDTITPDTLSNDGQLLYRWSRQRHLPNSNTVFTSLQLQNQITEYDAEIDSRRQKSLDETREVICDVVEQLRPTDDNLPYDLRPWALGWKRVKDSILSISVTSPPLSSCDNAETSNKEPSDDTFSSDSSTKSSETSIHSGETISKHKQYETRNKFVDLLLLIMEDTNKPEENVKREEYSPAELINMSRDDKGRFEEYMTENTKNSLFLCQPTVLEKKLWRERNCRSNRRSPNTVTFPNIIVEQKLFCKECRFKDFNVVS